MRLTIACPATLRSDANNLAMVLGYGPDDAETYVALNWQDAGGFVISWLVKVSK